MDVRFNTPAAGDPVCTSHHSPPNSFLTHSGSSLSGSTLPTLSFSNGEATPDAVLAPTRRRRGETQTQRWTQDEGSEGLRRVLEGESANILGPLRHKARDKGRQSQRAGEESSGSIAEIQKRALDLQTSPRRTLGYNKPKHLFTCLCEMVM